MEPTNQGEAPQVAKLGHVIQIDGGKIRSTWEKWFATRWKRR
jgi:hypothetical protein